MGSLAALLQLADSAFPSGAFSHSFGLETAIVEGRVVDAAHLETWVGRYVLDALAWLDCAAIALIVRDRVPADALDDALSATCFCFELRVAVRRVALAMLDAYAAMGIAKGEMLSYSEALATGSAHGHPAVAFALAARGADATPRDAIVAYASSTSAMLASAAVRAVPLGQRETARALWRLRPTLEECAETALAVRSADDLHAQAFEAEIAAMRHRRLEGRLFAS